jgi:hypothetical protein
MELPQLPISPRLELGEVALVYEARIRGNQALEEAK